VVAPRRESKEDARPQQIGDCVHQVSASGHHKREGDIEEADIADRGLAVEQRHAERLDRDDEDDVGGRTQREIGEEREAPQSGARAALEHQGSSAVRTAPNAAPSAAPSPKSSCA